MMIRGIAMRNHIRIGVLLTLLCVFIVPTLAQSVCPPSVLLALGRSASACYQLARGQACYGNGNAGAEYLIPTDQSFAQAADTIDLSTIANIITIPSDDISVVTLFVQANQPDTEETNTALILLGEASLQNLIPYTPFAVVKAIGNAKVRAVPQENSDILLEIAVNDTLIADGQSADGAWLRVKIPNTTNFGWVARDVITSPDDLTALNNRAETEDFQQPFANAFLNTGTTSACDGALPSGMLIQATAQNPTRFTLNGYELIIEGTIFVMTQPQLQFFVLSGDLNIQNEALQSFVPAGAEGTLASDNFLVEPYTLAEVSALPLTILPYRTTLTNPITPEEIAQLTLENSITPTPVVVYIAPTLDPNICRYIVRRNTTLQQGPAEFYEANGDIRAGASVTPTLQAQDPNGNTWWLLDNSNWILAEDVSVNGLCAELAVATDIRPPRYNTYVLEKCESTNGPLREGQFVTIEFMPPAFDSYDAALAAPRIDPGRIILDTDRLGISASNPIVFGTATGNKYAVRFSASWVATVGSHRIEGDRLSYELTCQITVPVG
jgi:hypothetical protein